MDYNSCFTNGTPCPTYLTPCQKSKFQQLLFWCRNNLCGAPAQPDVQLANGLSVNTLAYDRGDPLDTLYAFLNTTNGTNTGNYARFRIKNAGGAVIYNTWSDTLNLNTVFALPNIPDYGVFTIEVSDSSVYNPVCISAPTVVHLTIDPCNGDGVCDPVENAGACADCQFSNGTPRPLITQLEYFFDTDPGLGLGTQIAITPDSMLDLTANISTAGLVPGVHVLYLRAKDSHDKWAFTQKKMFYLRNTPANQTGALTQLEYFIDKDPGYGNGTPLTLANSVNSIADYNIPLSNVTPGVHVLYTRAKNDRGQWGFTQKKMFYVRTGSGSPREIVQLEYYLDNDPGYGNGVQVPITPDEVLDVNHLVSTAGLNGKHQIYVRAKDNWGNWSFVVQDTLKWSNDTLNLTSPNGGQAYTTGSAIANITFSKGTSVGPVTLQLVRPNGTVVYTIATNVAGSPYPSWTIPYTTNAGQYLIKVFETAEPTVADYSDNVFTINNAAGYCAAFTDLSAPGEVLDAASCLCGLGYIAPQPYNAYNNTYGVNPGADILRADLAKLVYYAIYQGNAASPAESFPVPFTDLQQSGDPYFKYAKALSYLQYGDAVTPFDRDFINFRPFEPIEVRYALKVLLEAYNIAPDPSAAGSLLGLLPGQDGYGYVHETHKRGWIPASVTSATANLVRGDMFVILRRLLNSCGGSCNAGCKNPGPTPGDYFNPGNFTPYNLGRNIGIGEGYFQSYTKTSFALPGIKLPMVFTHLYNSYLGQLPGPFLKTEPLGRGWSHTYNAYVIKERGWNDGATTFPDKYLVFWPDGTIHTYNAATRTPESYGVYDDLYTTPGGIMIKKQNQLRFYFKPFAASGDTVFMLEKIQDRFYNTITIVNEVVSNTPRIDKVIDTGGRVLDFSYDPAKPSKLARVTDQAGGRDIWFRVDNDNNLGFFVNAKGDTTVYGYGDTAAYNLLHSITLPEGNVVTNTYDADKRLASVAQPGVPAATVQVHTNYGSGQEYQSVITDPTNTVINQKYDARGFLKQKSIGATQLDLTRSAVADPSLVTQMNYEGFVSNYTYDGEGRVTSVALPGGVNHTFTYTALNDMATHKNPRNYTTTYTYDGYGNLDKRTDNMGFVTDYTGNSKGQIKKVITPTGIATNFSYDPYGNLISSVQPLQISYQFEYDNTGRRIRVTNPNAQVTEYEYDVLDQLTKNTRKSAVPGEEIPTIYSYNKNELPDTVTNALGGKTVFTYNERDLLSAMTFGDDTGQYTYRDDGLLNTYQKPGDQLFQYQYDALGRKTSDGYVSHYAYDDRDNITGVTKDGQTLAMTYDALNRLSAATYDGYTAAYTYDANGNVTKITYPGGFEVNYTYDPNDRLQNVQWANKTINYTYLNDGRLSQANMPNGTYRTFQYDAAGRMAGMAELRGATDTICAYTFALDLLGNHLEEHRTEPLCPPVIPTENVTYTYNAENELLGAGASNFTHDANGNRTLKDGVPYSWDAMDKLTALGSTTYQYDGLGLRRSATRNGVLKKYIWDVRGMGNVLAETDAAGNITYYYIHGLGLEARVNAATGAVHYYHADFRGSTIAMTDSAKVITHRYGYLPFGELLVQNETDPNPFKYVGKYGVMEEGDDIYYMRARYMDAVSGRFLSEDPVWGDNLYPYAGNNPVVLYDPKGESDDIINPEEIATNFAENQEKAGTVVAVLATSGELIAKGAAEGLTMMYGGSPGVGTLAVDATIELVGVIYDAGEMYFHYKVREKIERATTKIDVDNDSKLGQGNVAEMPQSYIMKTPPSMTNSPVKHIENERIKCVKGCFK